MTTTRRAFLSRASATSAGLSFLPRRVFRAMHANRSLTIDPKTRAIVGDDEAAALMAGPKPRNGWKAVRNGPKAALELYDLKADPGETENLAGRHPVLVTKAEALMRQARVDDPNWPMTAAKNNKKP